MPERIQRKRSKGCRMPPNTVSVCRPGRWGNLFIVSPAARPGSRSGATYICVPTVEDAVACYREFIEQRPEYLKEAKNQLRGKNLACFCPIGQPCHADVLLELVNR